MMGDLADVPFIKRERSMSETLLSPWSESAEAEATRVVRTESWPCYESSLQSSRLPQNEELPLEELLKRPFHAKARATERANSKVATEKGNHKGSCGDKGVSWCTLLLWAVIGTSGWWSTNAISAQLPLLTEVFPEGPRLGNKVAAMTQLGNLGLAVYMLARRRKPMDPAALVCVMLVLGSVALAGCSLISCSAVRPASESTILLALTLVAGCVGCTTSVHYWTLLLLYPPDCTLGASMGMGLGGVLANCFSCLQLCGRGERGPRFGPAPFFAGAAAFQLLTLVCFLVVNRRGQSSSKRWLAGSSLYNGAGTTESAHCLLSGAEEEHCGQQASNGHSDATQMGSRRSFYTANFALHGVTYLVPTLMPYVAAAYPSQRTQLLFWMLACQQCGETTGRGLVTSNLVAAGLCATTALLIFAGLTVGAVWPEALAATLDAQPAGVIVPAACFCYFLTYGMLQTAVFKRIRCLAPQQHVAEDVSAMTGSCGQLGSLTSTLVVFLGFEFYALLVHP